MQNIHNKGFDAGGFRSVLTPNRRLDQHYDYPFSDRGQSNSDIYAPKERRPVESNPDAASLLTANDLSLIAIDPPAEWLAEKSWE